MTKKVHVHEIAKTWSKRPMLMKSQKYGQRGVC